MLKFDQVIIKNEGKRPNEILKILKNKGINIIHNYDDIIGEHYKISLKQNFYINVIGNVDVQNFAIELHYSQDNKLFLINYEQYIILEYFIESIIKYIGYNEFDLENIKKAANLKRIENLINIRSGLVNKLIQSQKEIFNIDQELKFLGL